MENLFDISGKNIAITGAGGVLCGAMAKATATVTGIATGMAGIPIGVTSADYLPGGSDLIVTYRNIGDLNLWGGDLAFEWNVGQDWTMGGSYSFVSDDTFPIDDGSPIALNAPMHKGSISLGYASLFSGFNAAVHLRVNNEFPAVSAGYNGVVPAAQLVDLSAGYKLPNTRTTLHVSVTNVFNTDYQSFVGVPTMGRFAMFRVKYDLF